MTDLFEGGGSKVSLRGNIVVFDLDGTIANIDHRVHFLQSDPKDWAKFYAACVDDTPYHNIRSLLNELEMSSEVVIVTARSKVAELATRKWLKQHHVTYNRIFFVRSEKDFRSDFELKKDWLRTFPDREKVWLVFEDRDQCVTMWRGEGLTCLQVKQGDY